MLPKFNRAHLVSFGLFSVGLSTILLLPRILPAMIDFGLSVRPGSFAFNLWVRNPMPLTLEFYFHNWTNPEQVRNKSVKMHFAEIGPFAFHEVREKTDLMWNDNDTVSYHQRHTWVFDRERSIGGLDTLITSVNPVTVSAVYFARHWPFFMKKGLQYSIRAFAPEIHVTKRAGDILFAGYNDPFVTMSYNIPIDMGAPKLDKFAWFYNRNHTDHFDGLFNMRTNARNIGQIASWDGYSNTPFYDGECGKVHGSGGEIYGPNLKPDSISFFQSDCCRNMKLDFIRNETVNGILGYRYEASDSLLDNGDKVPENKCYNSGDHTPYGLMNISKCRYGTPGFASLPHFYKADPTYLEMIDGLTPSEERHNLHMTLEPTTGIPLDVSIRLQLNLLMKPVKYITTFEDIPTAYVPVLWFQQSARLPDYLMVALKFLLSFQTICLVMGGALIVAALMVAISTTTPVLVFYRSLNQSPRKMSLDPEFGSAKSYCHRDALTIDQGRTLLTAKL